MTDLPSSYWPLSASCGQNRRVLLIFALAALLLFLASSVAVAQEEAAIAGRIRNGTAGGNAIDPIEVVLHGLFERSEVQRWRTVSTEDGAFRFEGVIPREGLQYQVSTLHAGVLYFSASLPWEDLMKQDIILVVFDTTSDPSLVRLAQDNTVVLGVDLNAGNLQMMHMLVYENTGDRTYLGEAAPGGHLTVSIPLPPSAFQIQVGSGFRQSALILVDNTLRDSSPLPPGTKEAIIGYRAVYTGDSYLWHKTYPYDTSLVRLLVPLGITLSSSGLTQTESVRIGDTTYLQYEARDIAAGASLQASLSRLPLTAGARSQEMEKWLRFGGIGLALVAASGGLLYVAVWRRRTRSRDAGTSLSTRRAALATELARLEEEYQAGRLQEEDYKLQREEGRRALGVLLKQEDSHQPA
ncbi:MAG: hypothetical protein HY685_01015 [Chloroflexi bacterium]|nr:hypothetical protein [Chloroflexota bacterium]